LGTDSSVFGPAFGSFAVTELQACVKINKVPRQKTVKILIGRIFFTQAITLLMLLLLVFV
jgi:hypothetical protein